MASPLFLVDLREVRRVQPDALVVEPVRTMFNYATDKVSYRGMRVPASALIGEAGSESRGLDAVRGGTTLRRGAAVRCGSEHGQHLSSEASWRAANTCLNTFGGYGFVDAYDVERKFRETRQYQVASVNNNLIEAFVATKVLGMPR